MRLAARLTVLTVALAPGAGFAADYYPPVPGQSGYHALPPASGPQDFEWGGLYGGIYASYTAADFSATDAGVGFGNNITLATTPPTPTTFSVGPITFAGPSDSRANFGAFAGVNWRWDDVVIGLEADVNFAGLNGKSSTNYSQIEPPSSGVAYGITAVGANEYKMNGYGILKARAGMPIGRLLPYATIGLAIGYASASASFTGTQETYSVAGSVYTVTAVDPLTPQYAKKDSWILGAALGAGLDYAIVDNVMLRAEYQFVAFDKILGQQATLNVVKAGIGVKY